MVGANIQLATNSQVLWTYKFLTAQSIYTFSTPPVYPTVSPTYLSDNYYISKHTYNCFDSCGVVATQSAICEYYQTSGLTEEQLSKYERIPSCLQKCPSVFCESFSWASLGCPGGVGGSKADVLILLNKFGCYGYYLYTPK